MVLSIVQESFSVSTEHVLFPLYCTSVILSMKNVKQENCTLFLLCITTCNSNVLTQRTSLSFFEACNKSDCALIWSLKTKWYPLDVNRFHNIGYEAVCTDAVFKLLSLLFWCHQSFCLPFLSCQCLEFFWVLWESIYFVFNTARCKQEIKKFLRESIHVGHLYIQIVYSVIICVPSYPNFDPRCSWRETNWIEKEHLKLKLIVSKKRIKLFYLNIFMFIHTYMKQLSRKYLAGLMVKFFRKKFFWNSIFS